MNKIMTHKKILTNLILLLCFSSGYSEVKNYDLINAIKKLDFKKAADLVDNGYKDINEVDEDGNSALLLSVIARNFPLIKKLIDKGANINHQNEEGVSALIEASSNGYEGIVNILIKNKTDLNLTTITGYSALCKAIINDHKTVVMMLVNARAEMDKACEGIMPLILVSTKPTWSDIIDMFAYKGANLNVQNDRGQTPLMVATYYGDKSTDNIEALLRHGCDPTIKDKDGFTALDYTKNKEIKLMLKRAFAAKYSGRKVDL